MVDGSNQGTEGILPLVDSGRFQGTVEHDAIPKASRQLFPMPFMAPGEHQERDPSATGARHHGHAGQYELPARYRRRLSDDIVGILGVRQGRIRSTHYEHRIHGSDGAA